MFKRSMYVICDKVSRNCGSVMEFENDSTLNRWFLKVSSEPRFQHEFLRDVVIYHVGDLCIVNGVPTCNPCQPTIVLRGDDFFDCTSEANPDSSDSDAV